MWIRYCWDCGRWFKSARGARWHHRRFECQNVRPVPREVSRRMEGLGRQEMDAYYQPDEPYWPAWDESE